MSKLNVEVPDAVVIAARKHAIDKYGSMRGIGKIVEEALRAYLAKNNVPIEGEKIGGKGNFNSLIPSHAIEVLA